MIPDGMRAVSVRVNDVIGVAGYVLPGSKVDVLVTVSPTNQSTDMTSKVILNNVTVLTAGTRIERDVEKDNKPISVSVVTLLVDPLQSEALTPCQHRRQDSAGAPQSARQDDAADARHQAGDSAWPVGRVARPCRRRPRRIASPGGPGSPGPRRRGAGTAADDRNHPWR
jgi:pilus assembly protein CpaB